MFLAAAFFDAWDRLKEHLFAKFTHLAKDAFEFSLVRDGLLVKGRLLLGERHADGLGVDFAGQTPSSGRLRHDTALSDPSKFEQFCFEMLVALLEPLRGGRR